MLIVAATLSAKIADEPWRSSGSERCAVGQVVLHSADRIASEWIVAYVGVTISHQ